MNAKELLEIFKENITDTFCEKNRERLEEISGELVDIYNEEMKGKDAYDDIVQFMAYCSKISGRAASLKEQLDAIQKY